MYAFTNGPVRVALVLVLALMTGMASAQTHGNGQQGNNVRSVAPGSGGSGYKKPDCPVTHVSANCLPRRKMPRAVSKDQCECQIRRVNNGKTTLWVRDCYVQLPDETVYFCKPPIHGLPRG